MRPRKKNPGRNVREAERSTIAVKLRLPPDVAEELDDVAERWGVTRSGAVARLLTIGIARRDDLPDDLE